MIKEQELVSDASEGVEAESTGGFARQSETIFRQAVESAPNAMVIVDQLGKIMVVNAQMEILIPRQFRAAHPDHRSDFQNQPRARAMGAGRDLHGLRKDGSQFPVEIGLNPIQVEDGFCVVSTIVDITERKRAEQMFRLAVEVAPNAMVMVNQEGKIVLVNAQTEKLFGYKRQELIGGNVEVLVPGQFRVRNPDHRAAFLREPHSRAMGAGRDLYGLRKDGSQFPVEIGLNPIPVGDSFCVIISMVDITERKRSEQMFRLAVEAAPNAMVMVNQDGKIVLVNAQTERLFGYKREELIAQDVEILVPGQFRDRHPDHRSAFMQEPRTRAMGASRDLHGLRKDGTQFPIKIGLNPLRVEDGLWILSSIVDITERKRVEQELRLSEELFRLLVENVKDYGILMLDPEGRIRSCNAGAESINGYRAEISALFSPEDAASGLPATLLRKAAAEGRAEIEGPRIRKDGSQFWAHAVITAAPDTSGGLYGFVKVTHDITESKRAQEEIVRLNQGLELRVLERTGELTSVIAEFEAFSYSVAHDLRAPLRQIAGFSTIFAEDYGSQFDAEGLRLLKKIQSGAEHMGHLIDGMLNLARIGKPLAVRPMMVDDLAARAIKDIRMECEGREIDWRIEPLGEIVCEPILIRQVFVNLFSNALKYSRLRSRAVIHVSRSTAGKERRFQRAG